MTMCRRNNTAKYFFKLWKPRKFVKNLIALIISDRSNSSRHEASDAHFSVDRHGA